MIVSYFNSDINSSVETIIENLFVYFYFRIDWFALFVIDLNGKVIKNVADSGLREF
jgi:hypothetical protein